MTSSQLKRTVAGTTVAVLVAAVVAVVVLRRGSTPVNPSDWPEWPATPQVFVTDVALSEKVHDAFASDVKASLMKGIRLADWGKASAGLAPDFRASFPKADSGSVVPDGTLTIREFAGGSDTALLDGGKFIERLRDFQASWTAVERTTWRTFDFRLHPAGNRARFSTHFQMAGPRKAGGRADLQAIVQGEAILVSGAWKLLRLSVHEACLLENPSPPFREITDGAGFSFLESAENRTAAQEIIDARLVKTAGGLSCFDANGDGFWDLLATMANRQSVLFVNDGHGGFSRAPGPGSKPEEAGYFSLVTDLDGDGTLEAVGTQVTGYAQNDARVPLYTLRDGSWSPVTPAPGLPLPPGIRDVLVQAIVPSDIDRDGRLDFFYGTYSCNLSGKEKFNAISAYDGCDNFLFLNKGGLTFSEESDARGIQGTQYCLAAAFFDLDGDGDEDILEGNDFGPDIVWANNGNGTYAELRGDRLALDPTYTMGITIADWDNTGNWSIYISNMYSHAGNRIVPLAVGLSAAMREDAMAIAYGNQLFERRAGSAGWTESSLDRRVNWADWAWSCNFFDVDNDGDKELFVTNGYTSNRDAAAPDW